MITRILNSTITWIAAPIIAWSAVLTGTYKAMHPLSSGELKVIQSIEYSSTLKKSNISIPVFTSSWDEVTPDYNLFTPIRQSATFAQLGNVVPDQLEKIQNEYSNYLNKSSSAKRLYDSATFNPYASGLVLYLSQNKKYTELTSLLNQFSVFDSASLLISSFRKSEVRAAADVAIEYGFTPQGYQQLNDLLASATVSIKESMPTLNAGGFSEQWMGLTANSMWGQKFIYTGGQRAQQTKDKPQEGHSLTYFESYQPFWTDSWVKARLTENLLKLSEKSWINLIEPDIRNQFPQDKLYLAAGLFLETPDTISRRIEFLHVEATNIERYRAALAASQFIAEQKRLPITIAALKQYGYTPAEQVTPSEIANESYATSLTLIKSTMYKPFVEPEISVTIPLSKDIQDWLELPDNLNWRKLEMTETTNTFTWNAEITPTRNHTERLSNSQDTLALGLWLRSIASRPGLKIQYQEIYRTDDQTSISLNTENLAKYWNYVRPKRARDTIEKDAAPAPTAARIQFATAKQWCKISTPIRSELYTLPIILKPAP